MKLFALSVRLALALLAPPSTRAAEVFVWLESEQPTRANIELKTDAWAGTHTLQIRPQPTMKEEKQKQRGPDGKEVEVVVKKPEKIMYASDCLCLHRGPFRANGRFKPGEDWQSDDDRKAAKAVFEISPRPRAGEGRESKNERAPRR
jgi:hypothetical protein